MLTRGRAAKLKMAEQISTVQGLASPTVTIATVLSSIQTATVTSPSTPTGARVRMSTTASPGSEERGGREQLSLHGELDGYERYRRIGISLGLDQQALAQFVVDNVQRERKEEMERVERERERRERERERHEREVKEEKERLERAVEKERKRQEREAERKLLEARLEAEKQERERERKERERGT